MMYLKALSIRPPLQLISPSFPVTSKINVCVVIIILVCSKSHLQLITYDQSFYISHVSVHLQITTVLMLYSPEQSMRFCSESETSLPVALKCCPSRDPVVLNAQQEPHWPCMWGDTTRTFNITSYYVLIHGIAQLCGNMWSRDIILYLATVWA